MHTRRGVPLELMADPSAMVPLMGGTAWPNQSRRKFASCNEVVGEVYYLDKSKGQKMTLERLPNLVLINAITFYLNSRGPVSYFSFLFFCSLCVHSALRYFIIVQKTTSKTSPTFVIV